MRARFIQLLLVAFLFPSCGLLDEEQFPGARFPTGTAPYQDLGPVDLCIGSHRVGSPDTEMSGFCVPKGTRDSAADCQRHENHF